MDYSEKLKEKKWCLILCGAIIVYKFFLNYAFLKITGITELYTLMPNFWKGVNGAIWIGVLLYYMPWKAERASTFFLLMRIVLEIIPITIIYESCDKEVIYYNTVCAGMLLCILLVRKSSSIIFRKYAYRMSKWIVVGIIVICGVIMITSFVQNGAPQLTALNIWDVYKLRGGDNKFIINKYLNYLLKALIWFGIPLLLIKSVQENRKVIMLMSISFLLIIYLYTGMKSYLFTLPLIFCCAFADKISVFCYKVYALFCVGSVGIILLYFQSGVVRNIYSLFIRRVIFEPANLKFCFYEFFKVHPKMGIAGIVPTWIVENPYGTGIGYLISDYFWGTPTVNNNTGVLGEAYARFGLIGILIFWLIYAMLLKGIDQLQNRTSYAFAVGTFIFAMYSLTETWLFSALIFGEWFLGIAILCLYGKQRGFSSNKKR